MRKITSLSVADFRGITGQLDLSFRDPRSGKPASLVIVGDNGSGKSSITDAIQFALRGRLSQRSTGGEKLRREARSFASRRPLGVAIEFSDGRSFKRGGGLQGSSTESVLPRYIPEDFSYCPAVVRRHDIESFWSIPSTDRQSFFFDYLRSDYGGILQQDRLDALREANEQSYLAIVESSDDLELLTGVSVDDFPRNVRGLKPFREHTLLRRMGVGPRKNRTLPLEVEDAFARFAADLEWHNRAKAEYGAAANRPDETPRDLAPLLQAVSENVSRDFEATVNLPWILAIELTYANDAELDIRAVLENGERVDPVSVLSEAALDALALLILLEVHIACADLGQSKVLVLDDVFQSVDSVNRIRLLRHIVGRLSGWQLILALHDRLWLTLAQKAMHSSGHTFRTVEVIRTGFDSPPVLRESSGASPEPLEQLLQNFSSSASLAGATGRFLEELTDSMSVSLEVAVTRRRGDQYTLGDLWPPVLSALRKNGEEAMKDAGEQLAPFVDLRNLVGAHYNEWAAGLATTEARDFASAALNLWRAVHCGQCGKLFTKYKPVGGGAVIYAFPCKCSTARGDTAPGAET